VHIQHIAQAHTAYSEWVDHIALPHAGYKTRKNEGGTWGFLITEKEKSHEV